MRAGKGKKDLICTVPDSGKFRGYLFPERPEVVYCQINRVDASYFLELPPRASGFFGVFGSS